MVVSAGRADSLASGFAVSGPRLTANVALRPDGADVRNLTSRAVDRHDYQPFLAEGDIDFADDTSAYRDRDRIQAGLTLASRENRLPGDVGALPGRWRPGLSGRRFTSSGLFGT